jgi:hypothetical protein
MNNFLILVLALLFTSTFAFKLRHLDISEEDIKTFIADAEVAIGKAKADFEAAAATAISDFEAASANTAPADTAARVQQDGNVCEYIYDEGNYDAYYVCMDETYGEEMERIQRH